MHPSDDGDTNDPTKVANVLAAELYYLAADLGSTNPWAARFLRCAAIFVEPEAGVEVTKSSGEPGSANNVVRLFAGS